MCRQYSGFEGKPLMCNPECKRATAPRGMGTFHQATSQRTLPVGSPHVNQTIIPISLNREPLYNHRQLNQESLYHHHQPTTTMLDLRQQSQERLTIRFRSSSGDSPQPKLSIIIYLL